MILRQITCEPKGKRCSLKTKNDRYSHFSVKFISLLNKYYLKNNF